MIPRRTRALVVLLYGIGALAFGRALATTGDPDAPTDSDPATNLVDDPQAPIVIEQDTATPALVADLVVEEGLTPEGAEILVADEFPDVPPRVLRSILKEGRTLGKDTGH